MTTDQRGKAVIEFPTPLEIVITREFKAPIQLVYDVLTKTEHVRKTFPPFGEEMAVCEIDLRVGGDYHYVMVTKEGREMSFRGTFLDLQPPTKIVDTWLFDGWPDAQAVETVELHETHGVTTLTWRLAFSDQAGRDHMDRFDGIEANFDNIEVYLGTLLNPAATASE